MSSLRRSKSASLVAPLQPFLATPQSEDTLHTRRPRITRHHTSLALTELSGRSSAPTTRSGYQTPRGERTDDPFNLGGFFPSQLPGDENQAKEWTWLRELETEEETDPTPPDDAWLADGHVPTLDKMEDDETGEVIRREDKLGVLSFGPAFLSRETELVSAYDEQYLYSPYSEDMPEDSEALYASYCGLRRAHTAREQPVVSDIAEAGTGRLFCYSPADLEGEGEEEDGLWLSTFSRGLGIMLDVISV